MTRSMRSVRKGIDCYNEKYSINKIEKGNEVIILIIYVKYIISMNKGM